MSAVLLVIAVIGFTPSFLLRPYFRDTSIPTYLFVHGTLLLAWFTAFFHQNYLIARGKVQSHRRNGILWFVLVLGIIAANLYVLRSISVEAVQNQVSYYDVVRTPENSAGLVVGNIFITLISSIMVLIGYLGRKKFQVHQRAMFAASVILVLPAFDRFMRPFDLESIHPLLNFIVLANLFPLALILHDLKTRRKPHPVTWIFTAVLVLMVPVLAAVIGAGWGAGVVRFLG